MDKEPKILREEKKRPVTAQPYGIKTQMNKNTYSVRKRRRRRNLRSKSAHIYFNPEAQKAIKRPRTGINSKTRASFRKKIDNDKVVVFSAINKNLKKDLKMNVPLYKDGLMGHVIYEETKSRIIRPNSAKPFYRPGRTGIDRNKKLKYMRVRREIEREKKKLIKNFMTEAKKDEIFFLNNPHFFRKSSASIMKTNHSRDKRLNFQLENYLQVKNPLKHSYTQKRKQNSFHLQPGFRKSFTNQTIPFIAGLKKQSQRYSTMFGNRNRKKKYTVGDMIKKKNFEKMSFNFVNDDDFITLAKVDMR